MSDYRHHSTLPRLRVRSSDLAERGVEWVAGRVTGVRDGRPVIDDERVVDVSTVVWCTGFRQDFRWIGLPVVGEDGWPLENRGEVATAPGLFFCGLCFQYSGASMTIHGVGRDAAHVAGLITKRQGTVRRPAEQAA